MGLQDNFYPCMLRRAATAQQRLTEQELIQAAHNQDEADRWVQLDNNLKNILVNILSGPAATTCRQHQAEIGLEIYGQLNIRFSIPIGTRSVGYLTQLLKPTFDYNNFEDSKTHSQHGSLSYHAVSEAKTLNCQMLWRSQYYSTTPQAHSSNTYRWTQEPTRPMQRSRATNMEYYRTTTAFQKLQQTNPRIRSSNANFGGGQAPMDIGAINKGKYKGKSKGKNKGEYGNNKGYKGKGYNKGKGYGNNYNPFGNKGGKGKIGQGMPFRGMSNNNKGAYNKGKGKGFNKGKGGIQGCYRCGQQGHIARDCKMTVYNISDTTGNNDTYYDTTDQWYQHQQNYDNTWRNSDQRFVNAIPQQPPYYQQQPTIGIAITSSASPTGHNSNNPHSSSQDLISNNYHQQSTTGDTNASTSQQLRGLDDRQWISNPCLSNMVCNRPADLRAPPSTKTTIENSNRRSSSRSMATNGSTCRTATISHIVIPFYVCVTFHNPFCQSTDWQNKASTSPSVISQQSPTATALKQSSNRKMVSTFFQSQQQCHQPRSSMSTTQLVASRQHFHQSPSHQREPNGWLTTTTFGPTTAEVTLSGNIVDHVEHSSHQIHNVQSQRTDRKTTEEQLPTRQMAQQKTLKNNTKTCSHNIGGDYSTQHGLEKRGSKRRWTHVLHHHRC